MFTKPSRPSLLSGFLLIFFLFSCSPLFAMGDPGVKGITAHRGNSWDFPENTLPAFESALALGADWAELDIHRTKDGKLVVVHDRTTGRVGDKDLDIASATYEELLSVDVATDFRQRKGRSLEEVPVQRIPLLEEVIAIFLPQSKTKLSIQPKVDCVEETIQLIEKLGASHMVGFNDGNLAFMLKVKQLAPQIPVFWDRPADADLDEDIPIAQEKGFEALVVNHQGLTADKVQKIKAAGLESGAWTVNDQETMQKLLAYGVDRIYTDFPRLLEAVLPVEGSIVSEGIFPVHLQGIGVDEDQAIYWSWTDQLVKTDRDGKIIHQIPVDHHHGDLCYHNGKIYVAVNLGEFNQPAGQADSWVYAYDAASLEELGRYPVQEVVHGAGGMVFHDGKFFVVGGLVPGIEENYLYEYTMDFEFVQRHVLASGNTLMGIQTVEYENGNWWFGCYGEPTVLLQANEKLEMVSKRNFDASLGIAALPGGKMLIGTNTRIIGVGYVGRTFIYDKWP
jgi:glycerophosphoryl diester phosphodiesterase